jgi:hypothetical protein
MRPPHKNRNRNRHRSSGGGGGNNSGGGNPLSRVYESNGPDVKVRGNAQTIADKYLQLGRDAQSSGDIVMAESYFQHAEHYLRIVSAAQAYNQQNQQQFRRHDENDYDEDGEDGQEAQMQPRSGQQASAEANGLGEQPQVETEDLGGRTQPDQGNRPPREQNQGRDRFRPRWQDRRNDGQQAEGRNAGDQRQNPPQPRDDQPRNDAGASEEDSKDWEAPSFLRRPAAAAETESPAEPEAAPPPVKRRGERKPRKDAAAEKQAPPVAEPAAD